MADERLFEKAAPWLEERLGVPESEMRSGRTPVVALGGSAHGPLRGVKVGGRTIVACRPEWVGRLQEIVDDLDPDLLFSMFGAYELARVTLRDGVGIWGPSWYLFADEETWRPLEDDRVVMLEPSQLQDVDYRFFWHCRPDSLAGFAIYEGDRLAALAAVWDEGEPMWEIGMDVVQDAKLRGARQGGGQRGGAVDIGQWAGGRGFYRAVQRAVGPDAAVGRDAARLHVPARDGGRDEPGAAAPWRAVPWRGYTQPVPEMGNEPRDSPAEGEVGRGV